MRNKIKKVPTEKAIKLILKKLKGFVEDGFDIAEILDNSTMNNWQGIFPPKNDVKKPNETAWYLR